MATPENKIKQVLNKLNIGDVIPHMALFNKNSEHYVQLPHNKINQAIRKLKKDGYINQEKINKEAKAYRILKKVPKPK